MILQARGLDPDWRVKFPFLRSLVRLTQVSNDYRAWRVKLAQLLRPLNQGMKKSHVSNNYKPHDSFSPAGVTRKITRVREDPEESPGYHGSEEETDERVE